MKRFFPLAILLLFFQSQDGFCGFTFDAAGFAVKRLVAYDNGVMATDGKTFLLVTEQGEKIGAAHASIDNTYLLQSAVYSEGVFYMLYQHNSGSVRFALLALNDDLSVRWLRDYEQVSSTFGYAMAAAENGGVTVAGRSCISGFFVCGIDPSGEIVWNNTYAAGDPTAIPGALVKTSNGYTLAYKWVSDNAWHLGMMSIDLFGYTIESTSTAFANNFYIKGLTLTSDGFAALIQQPDISVNTITTFNNSLLAQQRFDLSSTKALHLTGIAFTNDEFFVSGNALETGTSNLDLMYASIKLNGLVGEGLSVSTNAYDDAHDVKIVGQKIWIGGVLSGNAHIATFGNFANKPCSFESLPVYIQSQTVSTVNANAGMSSGVSIDPQELFCTATSVNPTFSNECSFPETVTSVLPSNIINSEINLYPNPNNGVFNISIHQVDAAQVTVYDAVGKIMFQQSMTNEKVLVDLNHLSAGTYALVVSDASRGFVETKRFVIAR